MSSESGCPFTGGGQKLQARHRPSNRDWWPHYLNLSILHQHSPQSNPMGRVVSYKQRKMTMLLEGDRQLKNGLYE
jgi:catalase-peroxidase